MSDTTSELRQKLGSIEVWAVDPTNKHSIKTKLKYNEEAIDNILALLAAQKQQWEAEARIAVYREIEANWHHSGIKNYVIDMHEFELKKLAALDGVIGQADGLLATPVDAPKAQGHKADNRGESAHPKEEER